MRDVPQLGEREVLVATHAVRQSVCVHVGEPESDARHGDEAGHVPSPMRIRAGSGDDHREDDDRPVDEAAEALAHRRSAHPSGPMALCVAGHPYIIARAAAAIAIRCL